ncbi:MAG: VOC family protein [Candidatus Binataceae bacterium]|jgi:catechol 2,3-dioxygenase-like lactoylglutathione lyase family enzyme
MSDPQCVENPKTAGIHHLILTVNDLARSKAFYTALMPRLGYPTFHDLGGFMGWSTAGGRFAPSSKGGGSFWLKQADSRHAGKTFSKDRVGLCEVAFSAGSRAQVDALARDIESFGGRILHPAREYPEYIQGYYALFFTDPDGIKLEFAHLPI